MEECAAKLIKAGILYADDTPVEQMREVLIVVMLTATLILQSAAICHYRRPNATIQRYILRFTLVQHSFLGQSLCSQLLCLTASIIRSSQCPRSLRAASLLSEAI